MRRAAIRILVLAAVVVAAVELLGGGSSTYRVDAIFDTAKGVVAGDQVKIAGAVVGSVDGVSLTSGLRARIELAVDRRFAPFTTGASCTILPEGLISENYVACNPGPRAAAPLAADRSGAPTVPLAHTTEPVSVQDLLNIFSAPTDERLRLLINELGIATAGRGEDINAILTRSDPSLTQANRVLSVLNGQRAQIENAIGATEQVLGRLSSGTAQVRAFVDRASTVASATAAHRSALSAAVQRLPAMLEATDRGLASLRRATLASIPLLGALRVSGPSLSAVTTTLPAFARTGLPAVRALGAAADTGRRALKAATPVISRLRSLTATAGPVVPELAALLGNLRDTGGFEAALTLVYNLAAMSAVYDGVSHMAGVLITAQPGCLEGSLPNFLGLPPSAPGPGCNHSYYAPGGGTVPANAPDQGPQPDGSPGEVVSSTSTQSPSAEAVHASSAKATTIKPDSDALRRLLQYLVGS